MIPVRLRLRNFMCYTDVQEPLEFDGIQVACLAGRNGHGKSALLDAITWALWGKARARTSDELIHQSPTTNEMEVEFEFRLGGEQYRVIRKRLRRGRSGQSTLDLQVKTEDGSFRALTGNNLSETESQIVKLLRMSYETFTNSSFILQGRADSFTTKTPADRKQVLGEILDLGYYDRVEAKARQRANERQEQSAVLQQQIRDDDDELKLQPSLREQLQRLEGEQADLEEQVKLGEAHCETLRERLNRLRAAERELREHEDRMKDARARAERQQRMIATADAAIERARAVLAREEEIEQGYADLLRRRKELDGLSALQAEHGRLSYEASCVQRIIAQQRGQLEGRLGQLNGQISTNGTDPARLRRYEAELAAARSESEQLEKLEERRADLEARRTEAREQFAALKAHHQQHESRLAETRERRELLGTSPTCPVCRTALPPERHRELLGQYHREETQLADLARQAEHEKAELVKLGKALSAELAEIEQQLGRRKQNQERLAAAERTLARAQEQARALETIKLEVKGVETALATNDYAHDERKELVRLERQVLGLGYDATIHKAVSEVVAQLAQFETLRQDLVDARRTLTREQQARDEAQRELTEWQAVAQQADARRAELLVETADLAAVEAESAAADGDLRGKREALRKLDQELAAVRQHLSTMSFTEQRRDERRAELQRVLVERSIYQELTQAFGKKGLQAMLIETAIPEIQDEANRLLSLMSDGRMHVSFETQREAKSGDSTIETLDIIIRDELGERAYEMYSGGEAFRVNFAIRIALSKLLARRAGARLQTLVIDEGFGSQDEQGRERLVEAIRAIQPEFEKILVITHLADIKDLFDTRIEVTKTPAGSVIEVS